MGKPYASELAGLSDTYEWAISCEISYLRKLVSAASKSPLVAVGSGGSLTTAHVLSNLHLRRAEKFSSVLTPLEISSVSIDPATATWLLTAGGGNVDILKAFEVLVNQEPVQLAILCTKLGSQVESLAEAHPFVDFAGFSLPIEKDGFLATNSLFASAVLLTRAYSEEFGSKSEFLIEIDPPLQKLLNSEETWNQIREKVTPLLKRETTIVLYGPDSMAGAIDLESKFSEAALGHVQIADYRNFGHGRHHWLAKHGERTSILALSSRSDHELARKTLEQLPKGTLVAQIDLPGDADTVTLSSLLVAFHITEWAGEICGIDPGRPGVPPFGENLYNLRLENSPSQSSSSFKESDERLIIQRKTGKNKKHHLRHGTWNMWKEALNRFKAKLSTTFFSAIVFDYDGTIVETKARFQPPTTAISSELIRLLDKGIILGIATGRGRSVRCDLQKCIPQKYWDRVHVGYYNGAEMGTLSDNGRPNNRQEMHEALKHVLHSIKSQPELREIAKITERPYQITLELQQPAHESYLWEIVNQTLVEYGHSDVILLRSSHSVDILAPGVSKVTVIKALRAMLSDGSEVLNIGDRGRWPGNDYSLLNEPFSLSVDECNTSTNTCWNLGGSGQRGAHITLEYLKKLQLVEGKKQVRFFL